MMQCVCELKKDGWNLFFYKIRENDIREYSDGIVSIVVITRVY